MIKQLRVDDRLLHGQVAFSWIRRLKIQTLVIADDHFAYDEFFKMTLGLSKPNGVNLLVLEMQEAITYLRLHEADDRSIMVIVNSIEKGVYIIHQLPSINSLNLGVLREHYHAQSYTSNISLTKDEIKLCESLLQAGKEIELRMHYEDKSVYLKDILSSIS